MGTVIVYYSQHHGNTKKLLDAIAATDPSVKLLNAVENKTADLSGFDRIGLASGIYFSSFARQILSFAEKNLPEGKDVFFLNTCGAPAGVYFNAIRRITEAKGCRELGAYQCLGYDTFGPFKLVGGIAKGHPDEEEIAAAIRFYQEL